MEVVRVFNNELSSLYEVKPPISKAKMTQITKSAIKGIKFYKHIVQSVEKFIQKCRPEYKVPGLYVIDSIVRQSRHQFGAEKDVFGPRFVKNINATFQHLFKCPEDEKPKIIRVLNLWQKNQVFPIEIIQPLLDMGLPSNSNEYSMELPADTSKDSPANKTKEETPNKTSPWKGWPQGNEESAHDNKTYAEMSTKNLEKFNKAEMSNTVKEEDSSLSSIYKNQIKVEKNQEETVKFNKKLLDFDYGDEEDEEEEVKNEDSGLSNPPNALALSMAQNLLSNPELLQKLQQMTAGTLLPSEVSVPPHPTKVEEAEVYSQNMQNSPQLPLIPPTPYQQPVMSHNLHLSKCETDTDDRVLPEPTVPTRDLDERSLASVMASHDRLLPSLCLPAFPTGIPPNPPLPDKDDRILPDPPLPSRDLDERSLASIIAPPALPPMPYPDNTNLMQFQYDKNGIPFQPPLPMMEPMSMDPVYTGVMPPDPHLMQNSQGDEDERVMYSMPGEPPLPPQDFDERQIMLPTEERSRKERSRSRSGSRNRGRSGRRRSRSRSPRRKRSRSRSRTRKNRSRSRERERIREKERERERERERRRKGIPPIKKGCVSVCSTTLWLGHVPKSCSEMDISDNFGQFGTILSIDMIPPRGCAYVVMDRRQDANKALQKLKNVKLQGSSIKMAWAPGKGVKGKEFKDYWEVDLGVSYVPYEKIKEDLETLVLLEEGGFIDEDSLPDQLKALRQQTGDEKHSFNTNSNSVSEANVAYNEMPSAPNMVPPPIMPPTSVGLPMVLPHLMQPQFGQHLLGMLPPQAMVMQVPMGIPPPAPMLMVQQQSQGIMGNQPLSMVGAVPSLVPRALPPATTALANLKNSGQPESVLPSASVPLPTAVVGDATPTEEEGTTVSSPSVQITIPSSISIPTVPSSQPIATMGQYNPLMGMHANRPIISVPPPVSTAGAPIPYPPPNVGFNFPPPGMRPPGQTHGMPLNAQFPWMHKQVSSPFADADSNHTANSSAIRPVPPPPPQPGMPPHMLLNRPPFHDSQSSASNVNLKEVPKGKDKKPNGAEIVDNRNAPVQHDKSQEMVMSTDDESSMDIEYSRNDMPPGFPPDFSRSPMNMPRMRGPPGLMPPGPRFGPGPRGMGQLFPMRMGGPRGPMGGPGMHGRMEMDYDPRGPRIPMGPHGPRRNDNLHPPHDGRDWYPRDFEGPPFERERERHFRDDWGREGRDSWVTPKETESDPRRNFRDEDPKRDERREPWTHDQADNSKPPSEKIPANDPVDRKKDKPPSKAKNKSLMNDLFKLRIYQRGGGPPPKEYTIQKKDKPVRKVLKEESNKEIEKTLVANVENLPNQKDGVFEQNAISKKEKDREARKRSRWGRTLSEEREFQIQKQNEIEMRQTEIEMKFRSYEQSHVSQQNVSGNPVESTEVVPGENVVEKLKPSTENQCDLNTSEQGMMQSELNQPELTQPAPNLSELAQPEPEQSELVQYRPIQSELDQSEPIQSELEQSEPIQSELQLSEPIQSELEQSEPMQSELEQSEPMQSELEQSEPMQSELEQFEPVQSELEQFEPVQSELEQSKPMQSEVAQPILNPLSGDQSEINVPELNSVDRSPQTECKVDEDNSICMPVQYENSMDIINSKTQFENTVEMSEPNVIEGPVPNTVTPEGTNLFTDYTLTDDLNTDLPLNESESCKSSKVIVDISLETNVIENNAATPCSEIVNDLTTDSNVIESASKESDVLEDVNQNSSSPVPSMS